MPLAEAVQDSGSSSNEAHSDSSQSIGKRKRSTTRYFIQLFQKLFILQFLQSAWYNFPYFSFLVRLYSMVKDVETQLSNQTDKLNKITLMLEQSQARQRGTMTRNNGSMRGLVDTIFTIIIVLVFQYFLKWFAGSPKPAC